MNLEVLKNECPKLFKKLPDDIIDIRTLVIVDDNYEDAITSDEPTDMESDEYNYMVYITPTIQELIGEDGMIKLADSLDAHANIDDFYPSEEDLFGMLTDMNRDDITKVVFKALEEIVV